MKSPLLAGLLLSVVASAVMGGPATAAFPEKPLARTILTHVVYVRKDTDREWHIRAIGNLPCGPGLYAVVLNAQEKVVLHGEIPFGSHATNQPFLVTVPADGATGDYAIRLVGAQDNIMGLVLPLTDLPHEVYDGRSTALGYASAGQARLVAFKVPQGQTAVQASAGPAHFRILKADGSVLADSKTSALPADSAAKRGKKNEVVLRVQVAPGQTYWFDPYEPFYFGFTDPVYLTFDPERWFVPAFSLGDDRWWKGLAQ